MKNRLISNNSGIAADRKNGLSDDSLDEKKKRLTYNSRLYYTHNEQLKLFNFEILSEREALSANYTVVIAI